MKVILNGATAGTNFGDFLFAKMFQESVAEKVGFENVYWYRTRFSMSDFYEKRLNNPNRDRVKNMDALVYISGGYFCGHDRDVRDRIYRVLRYFIVGLKCIRHKIPYAVIGLEVGEPKQKWLRYIEKKILKNAQTIVVRNEESLACLNSHGINDAILTTDSAFSIRPSFFEGMTIPSEIDVCQKKILLFHVNPGVSGNVDLEEKVVPIVNAFLKNHPEYAVLVTADQFSPYQGEALDRVCDKLECEQKIKYYYEDPIALCKVINCADTVVTHKLHVGIVGARLGKSVISFSGHTEKIQRLYHQLGEDGRSAPLSTLCFEQGYDMLEKYYDKPINVSEDIRAEAQSNFSYLSEFLCKVERNKKS